MIFEKNKAKWPFVSRKKYEELLKSVEKPDNCACFCNHRDICNITSEICMPKEFSLINEIELAEAKIQLLEGIKNEIMRNDGLYLVNIESFPDNSSTKIRMTVKIMSYGDDESSYGPI